MIGKPAITSPVMRIIGVADPARSVAFYRDVLGFDIREHEGAREGVYGPVRIQFGDRDYPPNNWDEPQIAGSAMLFLRDKRHRRDARRDLRTRRTPERNRKR